jgi:hypothetical protein
MEQKYILYIFLSFLLGFVFTSLLNKKFYSNENFAEPSSWSCANNIMTPVRMNDKGDVECMATNGRDCLWTADLNTCNNTIVQNNDNSKLNPLACGDMHKSIYGSPGYDNPAHWCAITKAAFPPPAVTPQTAPLSTFQSQWNTIGCKSNLTENDVAWWRTKDNDTVKNDMSTYYSLASTCSGDTRQNDFCLPNSCKPPPPPPTTTVTSNDSTFDSEDSTSPIDTDPPSVSAVPIDFSRYTKIIGKSKSSKAIKRYNNNQPKCVKECASTKQCIGIEIATNKFGTICKTITDFSNPYNKPNAITYLKK